MQQKNAIAELKKGEILALCMEFIEFSNVTIFRFKLNRFFYIFTAAMTIIIIAIYTANDSAPLVPKSTIEQRLTPATV